MNGIVGTSVGCVEHSDVRRSSHPSTQPHEVPGLEQVDKVFTIQRVDVVALLSGLTHLVPLCYSINRR